MSRDDRLDRLGILAGRWRTTITLLDDQAGAGARTEASDIYTWSANGKFLHHDVDADMGGERMQSMEIIALDPSGTGYTTRSYDPDGTFSDFTAALEGQSWRLAGETQRFHGQFSEDGCTLSGQWDQKDGAGTWSPLMTVTLRKIRE